MAVESISDLEDILKSVTSGLPNLSEKKMFGCHALWANGNVFALVWKRGRIGVKLPHEDSYNELMKVNGSAPWKAGPMQMSHWVLVPTAFHKKPSELKKWTAKAHDQCSALEKKPKKESSAKKAKTTKKLKKKVK